MTRGPLLTKEYYHLYNRGTEKRRIFDTKSDYERFLGLLYLSNGTQPTHISNHRGSTLMQWLQMDRGEPLIDIAAYALMPNHFHLLVRQRKENGISNFMQKLMTGYTMYFNTKNKRTGTLFQGRYRSEHVQNDRYLKYLISYIHLNPIKLIDPAWKESGIVNSTRAKKFLEQYRYSSYIDYTDVPRKERGIIAMGSLPRYWKTRREFRKEIADWLTYNHSL